MKKLIASALAVSAGIVLAQTAANEVPAAPAAPAAPAEQPPRTAPAKPVRPRPKDRPAPGNRSNFVERRKLQLAAAAEEILKIYDKNNDGKLDDQEKAAMLEDFEKARKTMQLSGMYRQIERLDTNHDLKLIPEELEQLSTMPLRPGNNDRHHQQRPGRAGKPEKNGNPEPPEAK